MGREEHSLSRNKIGAAASLHDKASWEVGRPHGPNSIFMLTWFCAIFAAGAASERLSFLKISTGILSEIRIKLRDLAIGQARAG